MKYFNMESWTDLCRCCLAPDSEVSLFDADENVREKFSEITTIEVNSSLNYYLHQAFVTKVSCKASLPAIFF